MAEVQELSWDEIDIDETITSADMAASEDISSTPVGRFICVVESCTPKENAMKAYTCVAANLKFKIEAVLEYEQPVLDDEGKAIVRNGENLFKVMPPAEGKEDAANTKFKGRYLFDTVNLAHPKEKESMRNRRLFVAKKIGIISMTSKTITGADWQASPGKRIIITSAWNTWVDKTTKEKKQNVKVPWDGYETAPAGGALVEDIIEDDFSDI